MTTWKVEKEKMAELISFCPGKYAIEIGCYLGCTTFYLAEICRSLDKMLIAIDFWGEPQYNNAEPQYQEFIKNIEPVKENIIVIRSRSKDAIKSLPADTANNICMIFVDGDHSYPGALYDLQDYYPLISSGGSIVLHDIFDETHHTDTQKCWDIFVGGLPKPLVVNYMRYHASPEEMIEYNHPVVNNLDRGGIAWFYKS